VPFWVSKKLTEPLRQALTVLRLHWPTAEEALRAAFRKKALLHHPDRGGDRSEAGRFLCRAYWRRSRAGNLTREWGGRRLTVFRKGWRYHWCIAYPDDRQAARFSQGHGYADEGDAMRALWGQL
jgi:hypothetical protein